MFDSGSWPIVGSARMRALDRHSIEQLGISAEVLMENAGRSITDYIIEAHGSRLSAEPESTIQVVCGRGHNGGDGFVIARHLHQLGWPVAVACVADEGSLSGLVDSQYRRAAAVGVDVTFGSLQRIESGVIVDALFGTGLCRPLADDAEAAVLAINSASADRVAIVAVDIPSGIHSDTGQVMGAAVLASETVAVSLPKVGHLFEPGRGHCGRMSVARVGIADELPDDTANRVDRCAVATASGIGALLPARERSGHKGSFGHVLVVAGSEGKTGAAALSSVSAVRGGAGLVTLACPHGLNDILEALCVEVMTQPVGPKGGRHLSLDSLDALLALANDRSVAAIGPGLGTDPETSEAVRMFCERSVLPLVIDADGLNALGQDLGPIKARTGGTVLTPHPGEAARMLGVTAHEINRDRLGAARSLATASGAVVLLKGPGSVIAAPTGQAFINVTGGPTLATGGTGDVLTGLLAAYLAQGLDPMSAAVAAAYVHGAAADAWSALHGHAGLRASELSDLVPATTSALVLPASDAPEIGHRSWSARGHAGQRTLLSFPNP